MSDSHSQTKRYAKRLDRCEEILAYRFSDRALLLQCLTHSSYASTRLGSNERLEFLGDAILGFVISEILFDRCPQAAEGEMTRMRSALVSRASCTRAAEQCNLAECILIGKGLQTRNQIPASVLSAAVEALIAGVFLDGGDSAARGAISRLFKAELERTIASGPVINYKSRLQQIAQRDYAETPFYRITDEKGPDHQKCFEVVATIGDQSFTPAWGPSKKEAEQSAAQNALRELVPPPEPKR